MKKREHLKKRKHYGQRLCSYCGKRNLEHPRGTAFCTVPIQVTVALRAFAREHGRTWRSKLRAMWDLGVDTGELRQARNMIGPTRLGKIKP